MGRVVCLLMIIGLLSISGELFANDACSFIETSGGSFINPKNISIINSVDKKIAAIGSNLGRYKIYLFTNSGQKVIYKSYNGEYERDLVIIYLKDRVEKCLGVTD